MKVKGLDGSGEKQGSADLGDMEVDVIGFQLSVVGFRFTCFQFASFKSSQFDELAGVIAVIGER
jgi:hypothetical protein